MYHYIVVRYFSTIELKVVQHKIVERYFCMRDKIKATKEQVCLLITYLNHGTSLSARS